jgi:hypothetical protein
MRIERRITMTAIFNTKFTDSCDRNGQKVEILNVTKTRDGNRYAIKFEDGYVIERVYANELDFEY